jgi:plastocyanin
LISGPARLLAGCLLLLLQFVPAAVTQVNVDARVKIRPAKNNKNPADESNVVVWLTPLGAAESLSDANSRPPKNHTIVQKNKSFSPHVLAVPVGSRVAFPNQDPFFHNVFSLFQGRRFDLGLYEAGTSREVLFDKPGVSFIFCNIHPGMSAYVLALETSYFDISDKQGKISIAGVPPGQYKMELWYERAESADLNRLSKVVQMGQDVHLGTIEIPESAKFQPEHLNKHGKQYDPEVTPY